MANIGQLPAGDIAVRFEKEAPLSHEEMDINLTWLSIIRDTFFSKSGAGPFIINTEDDNGNTLTFSQAAQTIEKNYGFIHDFIDDDNVMSHLSWNLKQNDSFRQYVSDIMKNEPALNELYTALASKEEFVEWVKTTIKNWLMNLPDGDFYGIYMPVVHRLLDDSDVQPHLRYVASTPYAETDINNFTSPDSLVNEMPDGSIVYDASGQRLVFKVGNEWRLFDGSVAFTVAAS